MDKYFICLANSYKRGGRCIAGIEVIRDVNKNWAIVRNDDDSPKWIRPISETSYGEIPNKAAACIQMLSIVRLSGVIACPESAHKENVYYSFMERAGSDIVKEPRILNQLIDNTHQTIFRNRGRAVSAEKLSEIDYSLMLIHANKASAYRDETREKSKNRMKFTYHGDEYDFPITDAGFLREFKIEPEAYDNIPDVYLTISLGLEFEGWHHKLVAGVIIPTCIERAQDENDVSYMERQKKIHHNAYGKWTADDDKELKSLYEGGVSISDLSQMFGRNEGAIRSRIIKLNLDSDNTLPCLKEERTIQSASAAPSYPDWFETCERELENLLDKKREIEEQINDIRARILQGMEADGIENIRSEKFAVSYSPAKTIMQFDSRGFREEYEELYSRYCHPKQRESSIVVKRILK